jgi:ADP-ribosylglycohydrolase
MSIPIIAAYAYEPESYVMGRVVEHHMLTHKSVTVTAVLYVLVPLLLELYRGADLKKALDRAMGKMRPPKITGRQLFESYRAHRGPDNIPPKEKWDQHMTLEDEEETVRDLVHRLLETENDEDVGGALDRPNSRLSTACYCEHAFTLVLYLAYKYGSDDPRKALIQNVSLGGHTTARGAVLGAILGAAHGKAGAESVPFYGDLAAHETVVKEIDALFATV